ncbi:glycoside hydrolase family 26 protein [Nakamurella deserti]|uniref:glycoside hydrolase family 26 protein n=1 Tax=Nakamurella deserti TaxID=2164074 RepID=UPI0013007135|nr:glycosyl hydrolase [Nakamurella deserti]
MRHGATARIRAVLAAAVVLTLTGCAGPDGPPLIERVRVGAYIHLQDRPFLDPVAPQDLASFESRLGRLDIVHSFVTWGRQFDEFRNSTSVDHDLLLSLKPDGDLVRQINAGAQDGYLDTFAGQVAAFGRPVFLRFGHEMNGSWMSYSAGGGGPTAGEFVAAWRHVVDRFRLAGAGNARFVWSPNESDDPDVDGNRLEDYWPGTDYVDIAGFDAYDWGDAEPRRGDGENRSFEEIVEAPYERISRLAPGKEIWLCEFGTTEPGKADWIRDMFGSRAFPRLTAVIWFSEDDRRDTQRDWRLDSSDEAVQAWRDAVDRRPAPASSPAAPPAPPS